ncbi:MAG: DNA polymerase III subunit beta [Candidatus Marinarcus sp.]|uniref:DNA polymerase III subunit beta n=1 Tax=Candidatus Marinarcus sp. TaxID=3100987 RepID=UPI003AFF9591
MKFVLTKSIIENVISAMQPFLEKKDASSITSHIYLEVLDSKLTLKATDYEIGLESYIPDLINSVNGKATANGQNLLNIIKRLKESEITFEAIDNSLIIKQNKSNFKLPMYDANEYPSFPKNDNLNILNINNINLINSIKKITPAIDNNNPKFELNGALVDIKEDKINFVATDTRRLAVTHLQNISNKVNQFIIPKKAIIEIQKLFLDEIKIAYDDTNLIISTQNMQFFTKLINGKFPDYERIIPNSLKNNLSLPKAILIESIKLVTSLFSNIKITFTPNSIIFESLDEESESKTQIDIDLNITSEFYLAVNAKYLLDFLSLTNNENVTIGFNESNLPFYLEDDKFFTIVMPIVLEK